MYIFGSLSKLLQNLSQFEGLTEEFSQFMVAGPCRFQDHERCKT